MPHSLTVPQPCHESWADMVPNDTGRHCSKCCKTVIDFTTWEKEDIVSYLQQHHDTCGRFKNTQLATTSEGLTFVHALAKTEMPLWRKIAAIFLVAFGLVHTSCSTQTPHHVTTHVQQTTGEPILSHKDTAIPDTTKRHDDNNKGEPLLGKTQRDETRELQSIVPREPEPQEHIMGVSVPENAFDSVTKSAESR